MDKESIIKDAEKAYAAFLTSLGFDWENDPNMCDTPKRVSKMYVNELYSGIYDPAPKITAFDNVDKYDGIIFSGAIDVKSQCSHHAIAFFGKAYVAYIPGEKIIGLSKLNRIVDWFARRPQVQENLNMQIADYLDKTCIGNQGVAVMIECKHLCACVRGVQQDSTMITSKLTGAFKDNPAAREEFYDFISFSKTK